MSDHLERLRDLGGGAAPDPDVIRARARGIERRRRAVLGAGAGALTLVAVLAVLLRPADEAPTTLAGAESRSAAPAAAGLASTDTESTAGQAVTVETPSALKESASAALTSGGEKPSESRASERRAAAAAPESYAGASAADSEAGGGQLQASLAVSGSPASPSRPAKLTLRVCNTSGQTVERSFSDGQRYDFEITRGGSRVWRWSDDRMFTQSLGSEKWAPDACKSWSAMWDGRSSSGALVAPGSYQATGILSGSPALRSAPKTVCAVSC
jgi:hypothetical protein